MHDKKMRMSKDKVQVQSIVEEVLTLTRQSSGEVGSHSLSPGADFFTVEESCEGLLYVFLGWGWVFWCFSFWANLEKRRVFIKKSSCGSAETSEMGHFFVVVSV